MSDEPPTHLRSAAGFAAPDQFYQALIDAHRDLSAADSERLNARLILILANHIGDLDIVGEALAEARRGLDGRSVTPG